LEYSDGQAADLYYIEQPNGIKLKYSNNEPIYDIPQYSDLDRVYIDGNEWLVYRMNGIVLGISVQDIKAYGRYKQISVLVANYTLSAFDFGADNISITTNRNDKVKTIDVLDCNTYLKRIKNRQSWNMVGAAVLLSACDVANQYSGTYTQKSYTKIRSPYGNASISHVSQDNATANMYRQAYGNILSSQDMNDRNFNEQIQAGYLQKNTLNPNIELSGYVMVPYGQGTHYEPRCDEFVRSNTSFIIDITINGIVYSFIFME